MAPLTSLHFLYSRQSPQPPPPQQPKQDDNDNHHVGGWAWFLLALFIIVVLALIGWFVYARLRARRLGLPPPSLNPFSDNQRISTRNYPARGGIVGWFEGKWRSFRTGRHMAGGSYEGARGGQRRGAGPRFGALDPDEAWDARVGNEADEYGGYSGIEEQELGLRHGRTDSEPYMPRGRGYGPSGGLDEIEPARGRRPSRELDDRYDEEMGRKGRPTNPFGDDAAPSTLKGISPRPHEDASHKNDSPTERRSMFREDV